ncbi:hypothetical protein POTOM_028741 [Populus tomentosa]|uniref:EXS domain-containing protein n=1 Tax=Populus tomentosa TaxID=118781 RepID=A0A8X7ZEY7_POPTO|nr:hypothetical protein POTOM_028741 [Populus tomentosa]
MFGGQVVPPSNSPHLRKSGSRPVVFDLDGEQGNTEMEGLLHSTESNDLKIPSLPISTAAIMPSPILLWRFKVLLFFLWGFFCCKIGWDSVMRMSVNLRDLFLYEAFLYYNPLLLLTMMVWLWGVNLWVFAQSTISYAKIFDLDQNHLTHREIWKVFLYCAVALILIFPFDIFYLSSRYYLLRTLWRIVFPLQARTQSKHYWTIDSLAITFSDFFLADILTSMSKVFSDLERSVCRMVHRQVATIAWFEADSVCGSHSIGIPIILVLPYIFRLFQCLRQYKDTKEKTALFNGVLNSLYSFYWDVTRDWDLRYDDCYCTVSQLQSEKLLASDLQIRLLENAITIGWLPCLPGDFTGFALHSKQHVETLNYDTPFSTACLFCFTRIFKFNKPSLCSHLLHGRKWVYFWVIGSNFILRLAWTYKLSAHLRHNYLTVFTITALEMIRRFQWVFFRVENEWTKMSSKSNLQLSEISSEEDKLLAPSNHNV